VSGNKIREEILKWVTVSQMIAGLDIGSVALSVFCGTQDCVLRVSVVKQ